MRMVTRTWSASIKRCVGRGDLGFESLGTAEFEEAFGVGRIRSVDEQTENLDDIPSLMSKQVPTDVTEFLRSWVPTSTRIEQQLQTLKVFRITFAVASVVIQITVRPATD